MADGSKRLRIILVNLERQGCVVERRKQGWFVKFPNGESTTIHLTESDHRAEKNTRARVLRAGLSWPFDTGSGGKRFRK